MKMEEFGTIHTGLYTTGTTPDCERRFNDS